MCKPNELYHVIIIIIVVICCTEPYLRSCNWHASYIFLTTKSCCTNYVTERLYI